MIRDEFREVVERAIAKRPDVALDAIRQIVRAEIASHGALRDWFRCSKKCMHRRGTAFCALFGERIGPGDPPVACAACLWVFDNWNLRDKLAEVTP